MKMNRTSILRMPSAFLSRKNFQSFQRPEQTMYKKKAIFKNMKEILLTIFDLIVTLVLMLYSSVAALIRQIVPYKQRSKSIKDEVCLVTGAGSGIGKLMAKKLVILMLTLVLEQNIFIKLVKDGF